MKKKWFGIGLISLMSMILLGGCQTLMKSEDRYEPAYMKYSKSTTEERLADAEALHGLYYVNRLKTFIQAEKVKKGGTVFIGDSITQGFPIEKAFPNKNIVNRGIGGDRIDGVADRLDLCVRDLKPKKVYLMIGVNDLFGKFSSIEQLGSQYDLLLKGLRLAAPRAEIIVFSVLPLTDRFAEKNDLVHQLNQVIQELTAKHKVQYCDLHPYFADSRRDLRKDLTIEGIHLNLNGYIRWLQAILDEEEFLEAAIHLSELWCEKNGWSFSIAKINPPAKGDFPGNRGSNELVIYTPRYEKPTTGTNEWGKEAVVRKGKVVELVHRDSPIPSDGYVISGNGSAAQWIAENLRIGTPVNYSSHSLYIEISSESDLSPEDRVKYLKNELFEKLNRIKKSGMGQSKKGTASALLKKIQELETNETIADGVLDQLSHEMDGLKI